MTLEIQHVSGSYGKEPFWGVSSPEIIAYTYSTLEVCSPRVSDIRFLSPAFSNVPRVCTRFYRQPVNRWLSEMLIVRGGGMRARVTNLPNQTPV